MNIWIELATVCIEILLPWYFYSGMLGKSCCRLPVKVAIGAIYAIALSALSVFVAASSLRASGIMILTYIAAKAYYRRSWMETFYPTVLFFLFAIAADTICGIILQSGGIAPEALMGDGFERVIYNVFGKLVHLICLYVLLLVLKARFDTSTIIKALPLLSCQLLSIFICYQNYFMVSNNDGLKFLRFETLSLLYINLIMCIYIELLNRLHQREKETAEEKQQLLLQKKYYSDIIQRQEDTRSLWHDIKKYMASMEALVANENRQEAQKCLGRISTAFSDVINVIDTGNPLIDNILNYGMKKAVGMNVRLLPEVWVDKQINFPAEDLFVIIGNTMDNAIEACANIERERVVSVCILQKNNVLLYEIENPYVEENAYKPGDVHGYGLKNVISCVERNDGLMSITKENDIFKVSILLNLKEKQKF